MRSAGRWAWMLDPRLFRPIRPAPPGAPAAISRHSLLCQAEVLGNDPESPSPALQGRRRSCPQMVPTQSQGWGAQKEHLPWPGVREAFLEKASSDSGLAGKGQETGSEFRISHRQTWVQILTERPTPCDSGNPPSHPGNSSSWLAKWGSSSRFAGQWEGKMESGHRKLLAQCLART